MPFLITKTNSFIPGKRKKTLSHKIEIGAISLIVMTIILICTLSLVYLSHSNKVATRAYQLRSLEKKRQSLIVESELWNMKLSNAQALDTIENDPKIALMIKVGAPDFVRGDTAVASNANVSIN